LTLHTEAVRKERHKKRPTVADECHKNRRFKCACTNQRAKEEGVWGMYRKEGSCPAWGNAETGGNVTNCRQEELQ